MRVVISHLRGRSGNECSQDLGTIGKMRGNGVPSTVRPGVRTAEEPEPPIVWCFWFQQLLHSLRERKNKLCMLQRAGVGDATAQAWPREGLPGQHKGSYCFSSPGPPRTACHLHMHARSYRINSPRGKLAPRARSCCSHVSGNCFAQACLWFLPSTFLGTAGPRQARDIPSSTG